MGTSPMHLVPLVPQKTMTPLEPQPSISPGQFKTNSHSMTGSVSCSILTPINPFRKKKLLNTLWAGLIVGRRNGAVWAFGEALCHPFWGLWHVNTAFATTIVEIEDSSSHCSGKISPTNFSWILFQQWPLPHECWYHVNTQYLPVFAWLHNEFGSMTFLAEVTNSHTLWHISPCIKCHYAYTDIMHYENVNCTTVPILYHI